MELRKRKEKVAATENDGVKIKKPRSIVCAGGSAEEAAESYALPCQILRHVSIIL